MSPQDRINELTKRQVWYGSSMVVKLNAISGKWFYKVYAWIDNCKMLVMSGKYNGEDPDCLIKDTLLNLGIRKLKVGVPLT